MIVFEPTESTFATNGLGGLMPTDCIVYEDLNGRFELEMIHPIDPYNKYAKLAVGNVISVSTHRGDQYFRIYDVDYDIIAGSVVASARHIFYDLLANFIETVSIDTKNGTDALTAVETAFQYATGFTFTSNIATTKSAEYNRINPVQLIMGDIDNSMVRLWNGEVLRDNFTVSVNSRLGADNGAKISYRKNLVGLKVVENTKDVVTRIYPVSQGAGNTLIVLPEKYIDSANIGDYPSPIVGVIKYTDIRAGSDEFPDDASVQAEMRTRVAALYADGVDLPKLTFKAEMVDLSQTEEYAAFAQTSISLGDDVTVTYDPMSITQKLRVVSVAWDSLKERYKTLTIGDKDAALENHVASIDQDVFELKNKMSNDWFDEVAKNIIPCYESKVAAPVNAYNVCMTQHGTIIKGAGTGKYNIAIGYSPDISGNDNIAVGANAQVTGTDNVGIGDDAVVTGTRSIAMGKEATATADYAAAFGYQSEALDENAIAIGKYAYSQDANSTSVGVGTASVGVDATALGYCAWANNNYALAVGSLAKAGTVDSIAIGKNAEADDGTDNISIGPDTLTETGGANIAIGDTAAAKGWYNIVMGRNAFATSTLNNGDSNVVLGDESSATGDVNIAIGPTVDIDGWSNVAIGQNLTAASDRCILMGSGCDTNGDDNIAIGYLQKIGLTTVVGDGAQSVGIGQESYILGIKNIGLGFQNYVNGDNNITIGTSAEVTTAAHTPSEVFEKSIAIGYQAQATGDSCILIGNGPTATGDNVIIVGDGAASADNLIKIGYAQAGVILMDGASDDGMTFNSVATDKTPLRAKAIASQTANIMSVQDSSGNVVNGFTHEGFAMDIWGGM